MKIKTLPDKHSWFTIDSVPLNQAVDLVWLIMGSSLKTIIQQALVLRNRSDDFVELANGILLHATHWKPSEIRLPE